MRNLKILKAALFAAPALLLAVPASAQPGDHHGDIAQDHADHGEEAHQTPVDPNAVRVNLPEPAVAWADHRVQMEAGQRYSIRVQSDAFDPVARLVRAGSTDVLAEDDDSGGGMSPLIVFTPQTSGEYIVQVKSFAPGGSGEFAVSVNAMGALPALITSGARTERGAWQVHSGTLNASSAVDRGRKYADYELRMAEGEIAMLHVLGSGDMDTMLQVFTVSDRGLTPLAENDDGGGGVNPFILFAPGEAGTYVVRVIGYDDSATGAYRLRIGK